MENSFDSLEEIKKLPPEEAITALQQLLERDPGNDTALTLRGRIYWNLGKRSLAINDYLQAIKINPESNARLLLQHANSILDFYNKDLLNP